MLLFCYHFFRNWLTVGGIRSSGQSACLGIAKYVRNLLNRELKAIPSRPAVTKPAPVTVPWTTDKPSYVFDGAEYNVCHPLMKYGLMKTQAKL